MTNRESQIVQLLSDGVTDSADLARRLGISKRTLQGHKANLFSRLGIRNTGSLVTAIMKVQGLHAAILETDDVAEFPGGRN